MLLIEKMYYCVKRKFTAIYLRYKSFISTFLHGFRMSGHCAGRCIDGQRCAHARKLRLGLKAGSGPDPAEATEITECVRTEFTENYGKLRSSDTGIQRRYR